jgi:hypothetical protein
MNIVAARFIYPCDKIPDFAYDYLEHRLPVVTALRFRTHLKFCEGCAEFVRLYRMAADPVRFLEENPAPPELIERTLEFLEKEIGPVGE